VDRYLHPIPGALWEDLASAGLLSERALRITPAPHAPTQELS
jgi:hypothetical protein